MENWQVCNKSGEWKLQHTWCNWIIKEFPDGTFDKNNPDHYCKTCKEPEPEKKYCTVSGLVANPYCPSVTPEPPKPTEVCAIHGAQPVKKKLDPAYVYNPGDPDSIPFGNVFAKCALINKAEYSEEKLFDFIDWTVERNDANRTRAFFHGQWGLGTYNLVNLPHPYENGKFNLNKINMAWWDTVLRRLDYMIEAGLFPTIINHYRINHPSTNWIYPSMNTGYQGQELYGDRDYGKWQWVHYATGRKEIPEYESGEIDKATRDRWIAQFKGNMAYEKWFDDWTLSRLRAEFGSRFGTDYNEVPAGATWHSEEKKVNNSFGIGPRRRFTSAPLDWKCMGKLEGYMYEAHGVKDVEVYRDVRNTLLGHGYEEEFTACPDGHGDYWYCDAGMALAEAERRYAALLIEIAKDGNYYFGNGWHLNKKGTTSDFEKLKQRLDVPNQILGGWYEGRMGI